MRSEEGERGKEVGRELNGGQQATQNTHVHVHKSNKVWLLSTSYLSLMQIVPQNNGKDIVLLDPQLMPCRRDGVVGRRGEEDEREQERHRAHDSRCTIMPAITHS